MDAATLDHLRRLGAALSATFQVRKAELKGEEDADAELILETGDLLMRAKRDPLGVIAEHDARVRPGHREERRREQAGDGSEAFPVGQELGGTRARGLRGAPGHTRAVTGSAPVVGFLGPGEGAGKAGGGGDAVARHLSAGWTRLEYPGG